MSSRPERIAAKVIGSELEMNARPPAAKKKLAIASVGGREGRMDLAGRSHTKKYVKQASQQRRRGGCPIARGFGPGIRSFDDGHS